MRIFLTTFPTVTFLGLSVTPGWCPSPARSTSPDRPSASAAVFSKPLGVERKMIPSSQRPNLVSRDNPGGLKTKLETQNAVRAKTYNTRQPKPSPPTPGSGAMDRLQGM
jgi:hypothetical protein